MGSSGRVRAALANLVLVAVSLAFSAGALEIGLRLFWDGFYIKDADPWSVGSATRVWANRPDTVARRGEPEFVFVASHDAMGHRREPGTEGRASVQKRVFVLGDSFTYGVGVQDDETFCARVEQLDPRLDLVNGGVVGYGTGQELLMLRDDGEVVQPDAVMVGFFWNDVGNTYNRSEPDFQMRDGQLLDPPRVPVASDAEHRRDRRKYLRHSRAYRFVSDRQKMALYWFRVMLGLPVGSTDFVSEPDRDDAWALTHVLLREIRDESRRLGALPIFAWIPDQILIEPDTRVVGFEPADYDVADRVREIARELDVPFVDLEPALRAAHAAGGPRLYFRKDRHLTVRGNRVAAEAIQEALDSLLF